MSLTDYVIMPGTDYQSACDAIRKKNGETGIYKSGELAPAIEAITSGGTNLSNIEVYIADYADSATMIISEGAVDIYDRTIVS